MPLRQIRPGRISILVLNPNSSSAMTDGMVRAIRNMNLGDNIDFHAYTAPAESPSSIDSDRDIRLSHQAVTDDLTASGELDGDKYDGVLVACYSEHSLVGELSARHGDRLCIMGIFEASVLTALSLVSPFGGTSHGPGGYWGIVTTGAFWELHLADALAKYLGVSASGLRERNRVGSSGVGADGDNTGNERLQKSTKFAGVYSTGLRAQELHDGTVVEAEVRHRLHNATRRLLLSDRVHCVVMGCAGMAGLEAIVREAARDTYGNEHGDRLCIVDAVRAGVVMLESMVRAKRMFSLS